MPEENRLPTLEERIEMDKAAGDAYDRGDMEEFRRLSLLIPIEQEVAKFYVKIFGKEYFLKSGWDLSVANAELEPGWLDKYDGIEKMDLLEEITEEEEYAIYDQDMDFESGIM